MPSTDTSSERSAIVLPERVRKRVIELTSTLLPALKRSEVPSSLTPFLRFTPQRRARAAAHHIGVALASHAEFRTRIAEEAAKAASDVTDALKAGTPLDALDPVEVAAFAYLTQTENWEEYVTRVKQESTHSEKSPSSDAEETIAKLQAEWKRERRTLRSEISELKKERDALRSQLRAAEAQQRTHIAEVAQHRGQLEALRAELAQRERHSEAELRKVRAEKQEAAAALAAAQRASAAGEDAHTGRLSMLLHTLTDTAAGLRSELGVDVSAPSPADVVARRYSQKSAESKPHRDEVQRLDERLSLPGAHMIVDGYNVTKLGYPEISLERQRQRLLTSLSALASQTGAEITVVFDGTYRVHAVPAPRGVRVLFSQGDQIADEVIRELVAAEPEGRAVTVVTSDREVVHSTHSDTTHTVASSVLLERLARV